MNYAVIFIETPFKTSKHKKYIPIEKQIVSIHYHFNGNFEIHKTTNNNLESGVCLSTQLSATSGVLLNMSAVGLDILLPALFIEC